MKVTELVDETNAKWLDVNQLVKPRMEWASSGNGVLYSSVLVLLSDNCLLYGEWVARINRCFKKRGLLMRTPDNQFGSESWDDYLGLIAASTVCKNTDYPRRVLWYGIKHFGFYNNLEKFTWDSWLWRFPQVWVLAWAAAFPFLKWPLWPVIWLIAKIQVLDATNPGAVITSWIYLEACAKLGFSFSKLNTAREMLPQSLSNQFDVEHPYVKFSTGRQP